MQKKKKKLQNTKRKREFCISFVAETEWSYGAKERKRKSGLLRERGSGSEQDRKRSQNLKRRKTKIKIGSIIKSRERRKQNQPRNAQSTALTTTICFVFFFCCILSALLYRTEICKKKKCIQAKVFDTQKNKNI